MHIYIDASITLSGIQNLEFGWDRLIKKDLGNAFPVAVELGKTAP